MNEFMNELLGMWWVEVLSELQDPHSERSIAGLKRILKEEYGFDSDVIDYVVEAMTSTPTNFNIKSQPSGIEVDDNDTFVSAHLGDDYDLDEADDEEDDKPADDEPSGDGEESEEEPKEDDKAAAERDIQKNALTAFEKDKLSEDTWVKNKKSGSVYQVKNFNADTQDPATKDDIEKAKREKGDGDTSEKEVKEFSSASLKSESAKLEKIDDYVKNQDESTQQRADILKQNWNQFINAKTYEERVQAVRELADNNLIEGHAGGKKIYLSANTALPYKHLTGSSGTSISAEMNKILSDEGIDVPLRGGAKDRALADMSGKHNEAGVVAYLFPSDENKSAYEQTQKTLSELGGDEARFDEINKKAAAVMKRALPEGSTITGAEQVGGVGKTELAKLGIDPKIDPTDLIIKYKDADGNDQVMKVSAKTYTNPKNITMKNSGTGNAGETYLGDIGKDLDAKVADMRKRHTWDDTMSDQEKATQKKNLKQEYLGEFSKRMEELAKSKDGQKQLIKMWKDVHGCGQDVHTQVINKKTGDVDMHGPDYYCKPTPPFGVKFDGVKLVINMGGKDDSFMQVDLKTEDKGSPKLLFRHRVK